ncbi:prolyl oligopeptidase family serine peptidase [Aquimarina sp. ERC-38]|uniref:prolyl oligopeptidase family serine peptidase n=1 Tax=Aquimarina sp. ERC-38 TaxID=2949996 RepID=UPI002247B5C4|nr:prolyl oligopeptidase family serine peptidase [Aquimarina sp. ERC-38]UZO82177.1 prolyl oligopeptidase family serine peptidase [Aquimarina sp. ERC-38]
MNINKPPSFKGETKRYTYFGTTYQDSFSNMEDLKDSTITNWFHSQNVYANNILNKISNKEKLYKTLQQYDQTDGYALKNRVISEKGQYFFLKEFKEDNRQELFYRPLIKDTIAIKLFEPSKIDSFKEFTITKIKPSWDGELLALGLSQPGEEIAMIIFIEVSSKKVLPYKITNTDVNLGSGINWLPDNSGITYLYLPITDIQNEQFYLNTETVLYQLGENPNHRNVIFSKKKNPELNIMPEDFPLVSVHATNSDYIFGSISGVNSYKDTYMTTISDLKAGRYKWKKIFSHDDKIDQFYVYGKDSIVYSTAKNASKFKICKSSLNSVDATQNDCIIDENPNEVLIDFALQDTTILISTIKNGIESYVYSKSMKDQSPKVNMDLPVKAGSCYIYNKNNEIYISLNSWTLPRQLYQYDILKKEFDYIDIPQIPFPDAFKHISVEEIEVPSHDGTMVPLTILSKKDKKRDGKNSTLVLAYGSYGTSLRPVYQPAFLTWVLEGGIFAIAHVRGGGEKGEDWHKAGFKNTKPNTWKDANAATEYLITNKYTSKDKTALLATSAGGIMLARAITERPDLYRVALGIVPSINLTRSEFQVNGKNNIKEFGTVKDSVEFKALYEMDGFHHLKEDEEYPAVFFTAGYKDQRVVVWDPAKFMAKLQFYDNNYQERPKIFKVDFESGHGVNNSNTTFYKSVAEMYAFAFWQTGHPDYELGTSD